MTLSPSVCSAISFPELKASLGEQWLGRASLIGTHPDAISRSSVSMSIVLAARPFESASWPLPAPSRTSSIDSDVVSLLCAQIPPLLTRYET